MSDDIDRISLTLPASMTARLDGIVDEWEYASRSEAVRDALRDFFTAYDWEAADSNRHHGSVVVVHDHDHDSGLAGRLQTIQHDHADLVTAVQHVHLAHDRCLETLVVDGPAGAIQGLANELRSVEGVRQVKVVAVGSEQSASHDHEH